MTSSPLPENLNDSHMHAHAHKPAHALAYSPARVTILDIPFDNVTQKQALEKALAGFATPNSSRISGHAYFIATPNPEMLLEARKNPQFKEILQKTDLNIADGIGILLASRFLKTPLPERVTGVDFMLALCKHLPKGTKIFLLGAKEGVAEQVKMKLENLFPDVKIVGTFAGSPSKEDEQQICTQIQQSQAKILFAAYGTPKQELWLNSNLPRLQIVRLAIGVGGAFDFIAGIQKRAPKWMQKLWLEWLYRLIQEPKRIKRIYDATIEFPITLFLTK